MSASVLRDIVAATRRRVAALPQSLSEVACRKGAGLRFKSALASARPAIIAEINRASPSRGVIRAAADVRNIAQAYQRGGAVAISVLTEPQFFQGSNQDLRDVGSAVDLPLLRKDFILSEAQLLESANIGASAVLLIAAILTPLELGILRRTAEERLEMAALVEVHDEDEFRRAVDAGATLIGINNRDLHTFEVSLHTSERLAPAASPGITLVAESGIRTAADMQRLQAVGINAFLVGETLMSAADPALALRTLIEGATV
ncbi:MAG: indole-3-glycerol phosphate synthase TrpC [Terriglobales bacterium]